MQNVYSIDVDPVINTASYERKTELICRSTDWRMEALKLSERVHDQKRKINQIWRNVCNFN